MAVGLTMWLILVCPLMQSKTTVGRQARSQAQILPGFVIAIQRTINAAYRKVRIEDSISHLVCAPSVELSFFTPLVHSCVAKASALRCMLSSCFTASFSWKRKRIFPWTKNQTPGRLVKFRLLTLVE